MAAKLTEPELREIVAAIRQAGGVQRAAARILGVPPGTMAGKLRSAIRQGAITREELDGLRGREAKPMDSAARSGSREPGARSIEDDFSPQEINGAVRLLLRRSGQPDDPESVNAVREQIERKGLPLDCIAEVEKIKLFDSPQKGPDGEPVVVTGVSTWLKPGSQAPSWPVVQQGPRVTIKPAEIRPRARTGWGQALVAPDIQIGFWTAPDGSLIPMHDEAAIDVFRQAVRVVQPDVVVLVGDNSDFPELGKYLQTPGFARTTQATIDRRTLLAAQLRADAGPDCEIVEIEGNHEKRLATYILSNAMAAFGLRRGGDRPDEWPVMTVPFLCRYEESGTRYIAGYPAAEFWLNEGLRFVHGSKVRSGGSTAHAYLKGARHSTAFGHVHRIERAHITRHTRKGPRTVGAYCFGCLCRIDGRVPSSKSGIDADGLPVGETEDWQQGFGLIEYEVGGTLHSVEQFEIWNGWARFRGQELVASVDVNGERVA